MSSRTYSSPCRVALRSAERQKGAISFNNQPWAYWPAQMAMNPVRLRLTVQRNQDYQLIVPRIGVCRTRTWSMLVIGIEENTPVQAS